MLDADGNEIPTETVPFEPVRWHQYADLFPWIEGQAFRELVEDVRKNGVIEPIVFYEGAVLDGRNRYMAARELGIAYPRVEYDGTDPLGFVIAKNLTRRHLTESQRGLVAKRLETLKHGDNQHTAGDASLHVRREDAARLLNVSPRTVATAAKVVEAGAPELVAAVESGLVSVSAAADVATLPKEEQREVVARGEKEILERAKEIRAAKVERKRAEKIEATDRLRERNESLPPSDRKYSVIYADPPWSFDVWSGEGKDRSAENHYPTMTQAEIEALPVGALAADDCALFMWAVMPQLPEALRVIEAWGFDYKTCAFVWVKQTQDEERFATGMGYWTRANAEVCLLATRGSPARLNADVHQVVLAPRSEHSRKPEEVAARIERLVPGPYIELFARRPREGWEAWGNQADGAAA